MRAKPMCAVGAALALLLTTSTAQAHGLNVMAQRNGDVIKGLALYTDRTPAAQVYVEALNGQATRLAAATTDAEGRFELRLPEEPAVQVAVQGEEGHRATTLAETLTVASGDGDALYILREDIARLEHRLWLRDVLGGLGYLLGILGLWAFWQARRISTGAA